MIFNEIYGTYYSTVAAIIAEATKRELTETRISEIIRDKAFSESILTIIPAIRSEEWLLINRRLETPIKNIKNVPLTLLQKRWLKALLLDRRIALFEPSLAGLEDVAPLYRETDFIYFDRYEDGDPFNDQKYIMNFRLIRTALGMKEKLMISFVGARGACASGVFIPYRLEYSPKDDKFRLIVKGNTRIKTINLARIDTVEIAGNFSDNEIRQTRTKGIPLTLQLLDKRNALERVMLHFSNYKKETEYLGEKKYRMTLWYDMGDETELLIRILAFGPMVQVVSPESVVNQIKERLQKQLSCGLKK